jgi:hypothetical protein
MNAMIVAPRTTDWHRLKSLVLDSVSSPITKRVYNLGLDEFFEWFGQAPPSGFTKATVSAWRVALEAADSVPPLSTLGSLPYGSWRLSLPTTGC